MDHRLKHIKPDKAKRFLVKNGFEHINTKGSHFTYYNKNKHLMVQVICNNKELYPSNAKIMIQKSNIPIEEWLRFCCK
jgi:predicted RNA binding protein YcfA (HicA-like mRNA interferase family)